MAKRLTPTFNRILVEKIVPPSKTSAGVLLPEKTSQLNSGNVVAVCPGSRDKSGNLIPLSVKEGDHVLLPEYGGSQIKLDDKEYVIWNSIFKEVQNTRPIKTTNMIHLAWQKTLHQYIQHLLFKKTRCNHNNYL